VLVNTAECQFHVPIIVLLCDPTWKARLRRKTRSYCSLGGRRLSANSTVSDSSGIRSSALQSHNRQHIFLLRHNDSRDNCREVQWSGKRGSCDDAHTSSRASYTQQHWRTNWPMASSISLTTVASKCREQERVETCCRREIEWR